MAYQKKPLLGRPAGLWLARCVIGVLGVLFVCLWIPSVLVSFCAWQVGRAGRWTLGKLGVGVK